MSFVLFVLFQFLFLKIILNSSNHSILANLALKQQILILRARHRKKIKPSFTFILFWVFLKRFLSNWKDYLFIVQPETVIGWHRNLFKIYWSFISKNLFRKTAGRTPIMRELKELIIRIKTENISWGATKIHAELLHLGFKVSERTVSRCLKILFPNNKARQSWKTFLSNHADKIIAMDFCVSYTWNFKTLYSLFIISHKTREILYFRSTFNPNPSWLKQQIRNAFGFVEVLPKYLIMDNDSNFSKDFRSFLRRFGIIPKRTAFHSPWQNGIIERFNGTVRRELLDHIIIFDEDHLDRLLKEYVHYYNNSRPHLFRNKDSPLGRVYEPLPSKLYSPNAIPVLGGLHHVYRWHTTSK
ncbi:MAG TPA: integrase core domain-containing protein [Leptospiraceae bacterium]|nr:integrase core domain-containing protein [Leptospiraceae bacterium]HRG77396.1 integrase core domain-containing protein [Leptospiraceae bacterium]